MPQEKREGGRRRTYQFTLHSMTISLETIAGWIPQIRQKDGKQYKSI